MLKNLSNRVSAKTIEETYTENDITNQYQPDIGYLFDYPQRWLNDQSDYKAIGIRRLQVIPTSHVFTIVINIKWKKTEEEEGLTDYFQETLEIISENSFEEIIHKLVSDFRNVILYRSQTITTTPNISLMYNYDYRTGDFVLFIDRNDETSYDYLTFNIAQDSGNNLESFAKFLNQDWNDEVKANLENYDEVKVFSNVWDRSTLQFHASFSDNRRGFIGLNDDFYQNPSVFYDPPSNTFNFWIKFTTDGIHQILPLYSRFYIGLCFVRNYKNSLVTN